MPIQEVVDEYTRYVLNEIPIRLIDLRTMELVDRGFIRRHFLENMIEDITETDFYLARKAVKERVKYAILSHRWLEEGEPTYQEMSRSPGYAGKMEGGGGPGYEKLMKFCEEARRRGFEFAWSDTCCIDKTSSVELDESIRSMFRWYQNATLCIVHLAQTTSLEDLKDDEWFKRGWTLQELLAPKAVKFFNREWKPLTPNWENDKGCSDVMIAIEDATRISTRKLMEFSPWSRHIDERMTWAAKRRTTREEDMAYCLMGIFDVSMQIAYGEGARRAFHRLVEAIMLKCGSPTVLNFRLSAGNAPYALPALPLSPTDYVGHPNLGYIAHRLDIALTGRGLRVPLIILPLTFVDQRKEQDGRRNLQFRCSLYGIKDIFASMATLYEELEYSSTEFGLGIINH